MYKRKDIGSYYGSAIGISIGAFFLLLYEGWDYWYIFVIFICLSLMFYFVGSKNIKRREMKRKLGKNAKSDDVKDIEDMGIAFGKYLARIFSKNKERK